MFGPNCTPQYHHRTDLFNTMLKETKRRFKETFGLNDSDQVLFVPGSGTTALEACIYTAHVDGFFPLFSHMEFGKRLAELLFAHRKFQVGGDKNIIYTQYETSTSEYNSIGWKSPGLTVVDCVSSFPYYEPPPEADIWVTVTGKQLMLPPGLGIVVVRERVIKERFIRYSDTRYSSLNLVRYLNDATPHTPPIGLIHELYNALGMGYDVELLRMEIDSRRKMLEEAFPDIDLGVGPVVTFPKGFIPERIHNDYSLYGKNGQTQLFLWAERTPEYKALIKGIKDARTDPV